MNLCIEGAGAGPYLMSSVVITSSSGLTLGLLCINRDQNNKRCPWLGTLAVGDTDAG